jgi:hypothetical protein
MKVMRVGEGEDEDESDDDVEIVSGVRGVWWGKGLTDR